MEKEEEQTKKTNQKCVELISTLPRAKGWTSEYLYLFQGFWYREVIILEIINAQKHFKAQSSNIFLATYPKSGTTWLKALLFSIIIRTRYDYDHNHPLLTNNPHECIPFVEFSMNDLNMSRDNTLMSTHISYSSLPKSILDSGCRIIYLFRNPKDVFVSMWHFSTNLRPKELTTLSLEDAFDLFCKGVSPFGSCWDHVFGYWKASIECPDTVLFLKYEAIKSEPFVQAKRLAEFLGQPFSLEEEKNGVINKILDFCSFENLRNLEVNKVGLFLKDPKLVVQNNTFFRRGKVGDSKNFLTTEMEQRADRITKEKLKDLV